MLTQAIAYHSYTCCRSNGSCDRFNLGGTPSRTLSFVSLSATELSISQQRTHWLLGEYFLPYVRNTSSLPMVDNLTTRGNHETLAVPVPLALQNTQEPRSIVPNSTCGSFVRLESLHKLCECSIHLLTAADNHSWSWLSL